MGLGGQESFLELELSFRRQGVKKQKEGVELQAEGVKGARLQLHQVSQ